MSGIPTDSRIKAAIEAAAGAMTKSALNQSSIIVPGQNIGRTVMKDYNEINVLEMESVKEAKLESWIAKQVGMKLIRVYPNRQWGVGVNLKGQMITIQCPSLSNSKAYYISMVNISVHKLSARAVEAAGEILERYGISRNKKFNADTLETLPRNHEDEVISADGKADPIQKSII